MVETPKRWREDFSKGIIHPIPYWILPQDAPEWYEIAREHPNLVVNEAETRAAYHQLEHGSPRVGGTREEKPDEVLNALNRIRSASISKGKIRFTALFHHLSEDLLHKAFHELRFKAAPGCDKVTWTEYAANENQNITSLRHRILAGSYYPKPVRRVNIPKASGGLRPLGICTVEDKTVQYALKMILEEIYDPNFAETSFGFRPGTRAHDALDDLYMAITTKPIDYILDADIVGCFDNINQSILLEILKDRIGDARILELIKRTLEAGILDQGAFRISDNGVIQGSPLSPLLANVFLDYVLDDFVEWWKANFARGVVHYVRYADDFILGFQFKEEAEKFLEVLKDRLLCAGLRLNSKKTRLIPFGKKARIIRDDNGDVNTETFDFLGFTHKCGISWARRTFKLVRNTISGRLSKKLNDIKNKLDITLRKLSLEDNLKWINSVLQGYYAYFAVKDNIETLKCFRFAVMKLVFRGLHRLSQRCRWNWDSFNAFIGPRIIYASSSHPYPSDRINERRQTLRRLRRDLKSTGNIEHSYGIRPS